MRLVPNDQFAERLDEPFNALARRAEFQIAYADREKLESFGFTDEAIETIEEVKQGKEDYSDLEKVNGVGPKLAERIYDTLGITTVEELAEAASNGRLSAVDGVGRGTVDHIQKAVQWVGEPRMAWEEAAEVDAAVRDEIGSHFDRLKGVGSYRRKEETVGDMDMLGITNKGNVFVKPAFREMVDYVIRCGDRKMTGRFMETQVDIQLVTEAEWPAALQYFTGSQRHNIVMRADAKEKGWKLNEYGLWDRKTDERIPVDTEQELYNKIKGYYVPPEHR